MRCPTCYRPCEDEFLHRVSGQCRASAPEPRPERQRSTWTRPHKEREHSGPWPSAEHGTRSRYQRGCRCGGCVQANYAYLAGWRQRQVTP